jgi:hypothetical protein
MKGKVTEMNTAQTSPKSPFDDVDYPKLWHPRLLREWDFEHGPRWQDWNSRTGLYDFNFCPWKSDSPSFEVWLRAVPGLGWVNKKTKESWFRSYLKELRLIVVDSQGMRRPLVDDPREEHTCKGLVRMAKPFARHVERRYRDYSACASELKDYNYESRLSFEDLPDDLWYKYAESAIAFTKSLEVRDLGDERLVVAFGSRASIPEEFEALRCSAVDPTSAGFLHYFAETGDLGALGILPSPAA